MCAIREQRHAAEPANVVVTQLAAVVEREKYVGVQRHGSFRSTHADFAGHAEMNQQRAFFGGRFPRLEVEQEKFSKAPDARDGAAGQVLFEQGRIVNEVRLAQAHAQDAPARQNLAQTARDSFDFWQLWHTSILLRRGK